MLTYNPDTQSYDYTPSDEDLLTYDDILIMLDNEEVI